LPWRAPADAPRRGCPAPISARSPIHVVELTDAGEQAFLALRDAASAFDRQLGHGITADQLAHLENLLTRLVANATTIQDATPSTRR